MLPLEQHELHYWLRSSLPVLGSSRQGSSLSTQQTYNTLAEGMEDVGLSKKGCHLLGALTRKQCPEIFRPGGSKASSPSSHTLLIFEDLLLPRKGPPTFVFWTHSQSDIYISYLSAQNASTQSRVNVLLCISRVPECHKW